MFSVCAHLILFYFLRFNFSTASIGLDFKKIEELLNPKFNFTAAVQKALGKDYSLNEVCCFVFCSSYVSVLSKQLCPTNWYFLLHEDIHVQLHEDIHVQNCFSD